MFHDPENNKLFRSLNTSIEDTESLRPDGNLFEVEQRRIKFSTGYVEVKPDKSRSDTLKTHESLLRLRFYDQKCLQKLTKVDDCCPSSRILCHYLSVLS
ncbi:hypothetical protein CLU79DRAFT_779273 [Phycomyces nitens]|nr:hypothetical protein CLU79DRAFT_779273 [Phycomyces nitens]